MNTNRYYAVTDVYNFLNTIGDDLIGMDFHMDNTHESYLSEADLSEWLLWRYSKVKPFEGTGIPQAKLEFVLSQVPAYSRA